MCLLKALQVHKIPVVSVCKVMHGIWSSCTLYYCMWYCMMGYCTVNQTKRVLASCMSFGLYIFVIFLCLFLPRYMYRWRLSWSISLCHLMYATVGDDADRVKIYPAHGQPVVRYDTWNRISKVDNNLGSANKKLNIIKYFIVLLPFFALT